MKSQEKDTGKNKAIWVETTLLQRFDRRSGHHQAKVSKARNTKLINKKLKKVIKTLNPSKIIGNLVSVRPSVCLSVRTNAQSS